MGKKVFCAAQNGLKRLKVCYYVLCYVFALLSHEDATERSSYSTELESKLLSPIKTSVRCWMRVKCLSSPVEVTAAGAAGVIV